MDIIVKPHHLKGNSYMHTFDRQCPLQEAINEQLNNKEYYVGGANVNRKGKWRESLAIPNDWNVKTVTEFIKKANEGSEEVYIVTLTKN